MLDAPASRNLIYVLPGLVVYAAFRVRSDPGRARPQLHRMERPQPAGIGRARQLPEALRGRSLLHRAAQQRHPHPLLLRAAARGRHLPRGDPEQVGSNRERLALRTLLFMPYIMPTAVLGIIWAWLYNPAFGPFNQGLRLIGLGAIAIPWLGDFTFVLPAVGVVATWYFFGFCMVIFLTGMQRIDTALYDASHVDGARGWQPSSTSPSRCCCPRSASCCSSLSSPRSRAST